MTTDHRHPRCVGPTEVAAAAYKSAGELVERQRARIAELETGAVRHLEKIAALEVQVDELMCWTVGAFVDGEFDTERRSAFERHLAKCANCQDDARAMLQVVTRVSEMSTPLADTRARIVEAVDRWVSSDGSIGAVIDAHAEWKAKA